MHVVAFPIFVLDIFTLMTSLETGKRFLLSTEVLDMLKET